MISPEVAEAIIIAVLGIIIIEGLWLVMLTYFMYTRKREKEKKAKEEAEELKEMERRTIVEDIFLLHRSGLLLKHYTRRMRPNVDSDVLSGMLVAVQEFIKDSFRGEKGVLNEIKFGELRIVIVEGKWTIVACIVRGERILNLQPEITMALSDIEAKYPDLLTNWDGTLDSAPEVDIIMNKLIIGGYRGSPKPKEVKLKEELVAP